MNAAEFEGLLYTILSEEPFNNQIFHMTEEKDNYTISDYVYQNLGITIGETMRFLTCHQNNPPKLLKDDSFIMLLGEFSIR